MSDADCDTYRRERSEGSDRPDLDTVFDLLSDQRRRLLLYALSEAETATVAELASAVSERDGADREDVEVALRHVHLPRLVDAGVVDRDAGAVRYDGDPFLDAMLSRTAVADRERR